MYHNLSNIAKASAAPILSSDVAEPVGPTQYSRLSDIAEGLPRRSSENSYSYNITRDYNLACTASHYIVRILTN